MSQYFYDPPLNQTVLADFQEYDFCSNKNSSTIVLPHRQIKYPVDFDDELKIGDVRYDKMT